MKKTTKLLSMLVVLAMVLSAVFVLVGCNKETVDCKEVGHHDYVDGVCSICGAEAVYTSNGYLTATPSNWNELDYESATDTNILGYIQTGFFTYDYALNDGYTSKYNEDGTVNEDALNYDQYVIQYSAATGLEDVTSTYGSKWGLTSEEIEDGGYIWKITLREDLCWDDGTAITAADFVYTMKEQLNYDLLPFRANTYWSENGMKIHNAQSYYYNGRVSMEDCTGGTGAAAYNGYTWDKTQPNGGLPEEVASSIYFDLDNCYVASWTNSKYSSYVSAYGGMAAFWSTGFGLGVTADQISALDGKSLTEIVADEELSATLQYLLYSFWCTDENEEFGFFTYEYTNPSVDFEDVGIFAESNYELVVVLDNPEDWLNSDGSLNYTITNCSLPLVKESLYESCKTEPIAGADNWTTTYCTSVETTASWGPYKLTYFQEGKQYTLERNENWFGFALEENQDQYLTDKIVVEVIETNEAQRMAFWAGEVDSIDFADLGSLAAEYQTSDYAVFSPSGDGYAFGIQLFSDLATLNANGQNNSILAIKEFREALSLSFDRATFNADQMVGYQTGLGLLGTDYCYDAENGNTYRNSEQGKAALLRTYGYTETEDGKWTDGTNTYADIDEATASMTGYNLTLAKQKLAEAIEILTSNPEQYNYDSTKDITLRLGKFNAKGDRRAELLQGFIDELVEGSELEGKIKIKVVEVTASDSADEFRAGNFELYCVAAIGGAILYPFNAIGSYIGLGSVTYHEYADYTGEYLTMTMPEVDGVDYDGEGETLTLSVVDWFYSLNGTMSENPSYNWGSNEKCPLEVRLEILAMLEEFALQEYHSIQVAYDSSAYLNSAKSHTITSSYNLFMGLGGGRYVRYDYSDEEWSWFVEEHNGDLSTFYKTSGN